MLFVKVEELKPGMRLGKPIYNRNGVLLYDRDSKLTMQSIYSIKNFGLMGLYILEPAEPVPPMTEDDINFERFQTMSVFSIREDFDLIVRGKKDKTLGWLASLIIKNYATHDKKINFVQNLRSAEDYIYKHSLNVAILSALIAGKLGISGARLNTIVKAALLHDIGGLKYTMTMTEEDDSVEVHELIRKNSSEILSKMRDLGDDVLRLINVVQDRICNEENGGGTASSLSNVNASIIYVADAYDRMTAMKSYEEPTSEVTAIRVLLEHDMLFDKNVVNALIRGINILFPGVCVELTNKATGVVIKENEENLFEPWVLCFGSNQVLDLTQNVIKREVRIADIMKTMDNRIKLDTDLLENYQM